MNLVGPIGLATIGYAALALGGLAVVAYVLKMRRRRFEVPFSTLWHRVLREKDASSLWKRLKRLLSLLLTLLMLGLLLFAATEPMLGKADDDAKSVIILLDASASMKAEDGADREQRIDAAKREAIRILQSLGGGDSAMVMRMDGQTTPLSRFESDMPKLVHLVDKVRASDTPANLRRALGAAADALRGRPNPIVILIGDGAYPEETLDSVVWKQDQAAAGAGEQKLDAIDLSGIDVRYAPIGREGDNVGIVAFNARRYANDKTSYEVYIEVQNFGDEPAVRKLVLYNGDVATDIRDIELLPRQKLRQIYSRGGGTDTVLRASLETVSEEGVATAGPRHDVFPLDDQAWALLPARKKQKVLLVTQDNLYLEGAMLVYDNIEVDKLLPDEYEDELRRGTLPEYSAVVFDEHTPAELPPSPTHVLYFHPTGEHAPFEIRRTLSGPRITDADDDHPVMRWVTTDDINMDESSVYQVNRSAGEAVLASSVRDPIIAAKREGHRKIVAVGFPLSGTDMVLRVAFPLFLVNTLDWFAADDADLLTTYQTGTRAEVAIDGLVGVSEVTVTSPTGRQNRAPVIGGLAHFYAAEVGIHRLSAEGEDGQVLAELQLAANLASVTESDIAPSTELNFGGVAVPEPEGFEPTHRRSLWIYLVLLCVLLLCVEWLTFNRRVTV